MFNLRNTVLFALLLGLVAPVSAPHNKNDGKKCGSGKCSGKRKQLTDAEKAERKAKRAERKKNMTPGQQAKQAEKRAARKAKREKKSSTSSVTMPTDAL